MTNKTHEQIFDTIGDASITDAVYSRRNVLKKSSLGVAALALSGMPIGLAVMAESAMAQSSGSATSALTLALKLELLEQAFYQAGMNMYASSGTNPMFSTAEEDAVNEILGHENAHVALLSSVITGVTAPTYDFTGGSGANNGPFDPFNGTDTTDFFALAQLLEDLGVRAYKGQAPNLIGDTHLVTAFQIHSVEARHAAQIRTLRGTTPWVDAASALTDYDSGFATAQAPIVEAVYGPEVAGTDTNGQPTFSKGEDNVLQYSSYAPLGYNSGNKPAFDEPLDATNVAAIAALFGVS